MALYFFKEHKLTHCMRWPGVDLLLILDFSEWDEGDYRILVHIFFYTHFRQCQRKYTLGSRQNGETGGE